MDITKLLKFIRGRFTKPITLIVLISVIIVLVFLKQQMFYRIVIILLVIAGAFFAKKYLVTGARDLLESEKNKRERDRYKQELQRQKGLKIEISPRLWPTCKLNLFKLDCNLKKTYKCAFNDKGALMDFDEAANKAGRYKFFGTYEIAFEANYGIDFKELRKTIDDSRKKIIISNAHMKYLGGITRREDWLLSIALEKKKTLAMKMMRGNSENWVYVDNIPACIQDHKDKIVNEIRETMRERGPEDIKAWGVESKEFREMTCAVLKGLLSSKYPDYSVEIRLPMSGEAQIADEGSLLETDKWK